MHAKWIWRYGGEKQALWRKIINQKFGGATNALFPNQTNMSVCFSLWTSILKSKSFVESGTKLVLGDDSGIYFWNDVWVGEQSLRLSFLKIKMLWEEIW